MKKKNNRLNEFRENKSNDSKKQHKRIKNVHHRFFERCYDFFIKQRN